QKGVHPGQDFPGTETACAAERQSDTERIKNSAAGTHYMNLTERKGTMPADPVCGMEIEDWDAVAQSTYEGEIYDFCSRACKDQFARNPKLYTGEDETEEETVE